MKGVWKAICILCTTTSALAAQPPPRIALDTPAAGIGISVTLERSPESRSEPPDWVDTAIFHVRDRNGEQQVDGGEWSGLWTDAAYMARVRKAVSWHPPYLLVERRCTGNAWACGHIAVFRVRNGVAHHLGDLGGASEQVADDAAIRKGRFSEIYDRFEHGIPGSLSHLSHASAPVLVVLLKDTGSGLVVDRRATCRDEINPLPALGDPPGDTPHDVNIEVYLSGLARIALIQRYCDRRADLKRTLAVADRTLSARDAAALRAAMAGVTPFEAPFASR
jgi:hypothetical protein